MTAFVAVSLTLIGPCVFKILKSFLLFALGYASWFESRLREYRESTLGEHTPLLSQAPQQNVNATNSRDDSSQQQSLVQDWGLGGLCGEREDHPMSGTQCQSCRLRAQSSAVNGAAGPKHALQNSENSRTTVFKIIQEVEKPSTASIVIIILLFGLAVALAIASAFSAKIASNRIGLSSSKSCGIWQFDDNAGEEPSYQDDINNYRKEARASQYARNCYNSLNTANTLSCKVFYNESIAYSTQTGQRCPFSTPELCAGGLYSAITFNTGLVDASTIGINAASTHKFRRTTTCSPLNISEPYTQQKFLSRNETSYQYFYGPKDNSEYTFNTSGQPFDWLIPAYSVK